MARELPNHEARGNDTEDGCESRSARLFQCARCHALTKICSHCDRGNVYCGDCAIPARKKARQDTLHQSLLATPFKKRLSAQPKAMSLKPKSVSFWDSLSVLAGFNGIRHPCIISNARYVV